MFLEFRVSDGYVLKIHTEMPAKIGEGNSIAIDNQNIYSPGDEFVNYITVYDVDEHGNLGGSGSVKNSVVIAELMLKLEQKTQEINVMKKALDEIILGGVL